MAERGGQAAADGFQYQYLVTLEALLDATECRVAGAAAVLIEPVSIQDDDAPDPDAVDFELVDDDGTSVHAAQVKSGSAGTQMSAPDAFGILLRLIRARPQARTYRLITNIRLHPKAAELNRALDTADAHELRARLQQLMERGRWRDEPALMSVEELNRLRRARISVDFRERIELRDQLRERMRRLRNEHHSGLGHDSAGRLTNYLAFEIHRRASGEFNGIFSLVKFREELLVPGLQIAYELGEFDWGIMVGGIPAPPDIPRPDLVGQIRTALTCGGERVVTQCALLGPSGIGKTSVAAAYVHDVADSYDHIFWINGESSASLQASFQRVHHWLRPRADADADPGGLRDRVRTLLSISVRPWLMVIDNVVDRRLVEPWLPSSGRGHILITSTNQVSWATHRVKVAVQIMAPGQATALIRLRLGQDQDWDATSEQTAADLAQRLQYWPLAIELACGHLAGCELGLGDAARYLDQIRDLALDDTDAVPAGYPETLVGAIRLALVRLLDKGETHPASAGAAHALFPAAYFASRQIPLWLLYFSTLMSSENATQIGIRHPVVFDPDTKVPFTVHEMHRALRTESLAQRDEPLCTLPQQEWSAVHPEGVDDTISVNEIVQHVIRTLAEDGSNTASEVLNQTAYHTQGWLAAFINADDDEHFLAVLPHVQSLASHASRLGVATDNLAVLWGNLAGAYILQGMLDDAREALESELAYLLNRPEPAPLLELKTRSQLADVLRNTGAMPEIWLQHLRRARDLAVQLADSRPQEISAVVGNCLTILANHTGRTAAAPPVRALADDLWSLQERLPRTRRMEAQLEIGDLIHALSDENMPDQEVERRCRWLLKDDSLTRLQRLEVTTLLAEALAFQRRWNDTWQHLQDIRQHLIQSPLHPQVMTRALHNIGLQVGLAIATGVPECRTAFMIVYGGVLPSPEPECRPLLTTLLDMVSRIPDGHLSLEAGVTCVPYKMQLLHLLDALVDQDHDRIRQVQLSLTRFDSADLDQGSEVGWRNLSHAVVAAAVSRTLHGT
ncbi:NB-ARC domain-containing protein [Streptomyces sp. YS-3]|uniref:NB-ARC domain-containing protein n=1 Tax=Streptomyces sp. YS-3 TaxID=3381352 RepID=UPI003862B06F